MLKTESAVSAWQRSVPTRSGAVCRHWGFVKPNIYVRASECSASVCTRSAPSRNVSRALLHRGRVGGAGSEGNQPLLLLVCQRALARTTTALHQVAFLWQFPTAKSPRTKALPQSWEWDWGLGPLPSSGRDEPGESILDLESISVSLQCIDCFLFARHL